jgi:hypothetical protein
MGDLINSSDLVCKRISPTLENTWQLSLELGVQTTEIFCKDTGNILVFNIKPSEGCFSNLQVAHGQKFIFNRPCYITIQQSTDWAMDVHNSNLAVKPVVYYEDLTNLNYKLKHIFKPTSY